MEGKAKSARRLEQEASGGARREQLRRASLICPLPLRVHNSTLGAL